MSCLDRGSWGEVPLGKLTPCALLADLGSWGGEPPNKKSIKHGLDPFIDYRGVTHPMYYTYFHRVPSLYCQNEYFLKLPGDLQKVCKNTGVLAHRVQDAYVFIGKTAPWNPVAAPFYQVAIYVVSACYDPKWTVDNGI